MKKDAIFTIRGLYQTEDEDTDAIELVTQGHFSRRNGTYYLKYKESELTGYEGCETTLAIKGSDQVTITRAGGPASSCLFLENKRRHQCVYETPFGVLNIGVYTNSIESTLTDEGGDLRFHYSLDINSASTTENNVTVSVKECKQLAQPE